jgi:transposase-like protein
VTTTTKQSTNSAPMGNTNTTQATPAPTVMPKSATVPLVTLKQYVSNIRHMVAQSFNITDKALAQQLQNGMHLKDIAMQHGLSDTQLQRLLSSSISTGFQPAISAGSVTQAQVSTFIQQAQQNPTTLEQQLSILPPTVAHW